MALLYEDLTRKILGAAMQVHNTLGCGFLEAVYQEALELELERQDIAFIAQQQLNISYKKQLLKHKSLEWKRFVL